MCEVVVCVRCIEVWKTSKLPARKRFYSFRLYEKNQKYPKGCGPLDSRETIQISGRYVIVAKKTGVHQVTGDTGNYNFAGYRRQ